MLEVEMRSITPDAIKITPNVWTCSELLYLIRIDGETFAFANDEETGLEIIKSVCTSEVKRWEKPSYRNVFQRVLDDGRHVEICTQSLGNLVNGPVKTREVLTLTAVPKGMYFKNPPGQKAVIPGEVIVSRAEGAEQTPRIIVPVKDGLATKPSFVRPDKEWF